MSIPALATCSQENDGGRESSVDAGSESPNYCLYFLVCAAKSGPLASLIKVGIADRFPIRYRQHTATWGLFDLSRSALLRVRNRREALDLERNLRNHFGDPVSENIAKAAGKTLTSEDFIAMGSWRRYPGRRDNGYTEFYAFDCLTRMLSHVEDWRTASDGRRTGTRLQKD